MAERMVMNVKKRLSGLCSAVIMCLLTISPPTEAKTWLPLQIVYVTVERDHEEDFVKQLHVIGDRMGYAIRVAPRESGPRGEIYVELWRNDLHIDVGNPFHHERFQVGFYSLGLVPKEAEDAARNDFIEALRKSADVIPGGAKIEVDK
jgi:hypothetical protein